MTYVFNYGRKDAGYEVPVGTEFIARSLRLRNGRPEVVEERLRVFGDEYGFGSAESLEEVIPAGRASQKAGKENIMKSYRIEFHNNRGSFAIDAIAHTVQGSWDERSCSTDLDGVEFGTVIVDDENAEYLEEILDIDKNVIGYTIR